MAKPTVRKYRRNASEPGDRPWPPRPTRAIHKRPKATPLQVWMKNRLKRNKRQSCPCDALPWRHRRGTRAEVRIGRRTFTLTCPH